MLVKKDQLCDICGDKGIGEAIVTCSRCNKFREHIYCMRVNLDTIPESWFCEACLCRNEDHQNICPSDCHGRIREEEIRESSNRKVTFEVPDASKATSSSCKPAGRLLSRDFVPKKVVTGKVKYLQIQDIYAISSGDRGKASFPQGVHRSRMMSFGGHRRTTAKKTSGAAASSPKLTSKKEHAFNSIGNPKPVTVSGVQPISPQKQAANKVSQPLEKSPSTSPCLYSTSGTPKSVAVFTRRKKRPIGDEVHHSPVDRIRPVVHGTDEKGKRNSAPSKDHFQENPVNAIVPFNQDKLPFQFGKEDLPNPPAVRAAWKGRFEISDFLHETYDGFQAHPPEQVSKRAFLASKQMPEVLQFSLLPRIIVWPEIFRKESPSEFDIALYFWADSSCRSSEKYNILMQLMNEQDLSMQSHFDGVTLLIFSSKQLPVESQRMDKRNYLWGVFSSSKDQNSKGKQVAVDIPLTVPPRIVKKSNFSHDDQPEVDMEIDMVGGKEVGRTDTVVKKNISARRHQSVQESAVAKHVPQVKTEHCDYFDTSLFPKPVTTTEGPLTLTFVKISNGGAQEMTPPPGPGLSRPSIVTPLAEFSRPSIMTPPAGCSRLNNVTPPPGFSRPNIVTPPAEFSRPSIVTPPAGCSRLSNVTPPPGFYRPSNMIPLREPPHFPHRLDSPPGFSRVPGTAATKKIKAEFGTTY